MKENSNMCRCDHMVKCGQALWFKFLWIKMCHKLNTEEQVCLMNNTKSVEDEIKFLCVNIQPIMHQEASL